MTYMSGHRILARPLGGLTRRMDSSRVDILQHPPKQCDNDAVLLVSVVFSRDQITPNGEFVTHRVARTVGDVTC